MWQDLKNFYHLFNAIFVNLWFRFPSKNLTVIGVTGTDGKTTTVNIIYHLLKKSGLNVSMISTVGAIINGKKYDVGFHTTTPSSWQIQGFLKKIPKDESKDKKYMVIEVTSHAIDQNRIWGISFDVAVLTNVSREHLDYHKTYERYVATKAKLLELARTAIINKDDESYEIIRLKLKTQDSKSQTKASKVITYGMKSNSDINPNNFPFKTRLIGEFNKYNILAAITVCKALGLEDRDIKKGIETFEVPIGREEVVYDKNFKVMIDFAHTPNALEQILSTIRSKVKGKLIHVFGSAGERDWQKRPQMGKISSRYSDCIILTVEDPRSESVEKIMEEIEKGIFNERQNIKFQKEKKYYFKIADRQEAINKAIKMARKGDLVLITGKGHEKSMNYGNGEKVWSEHEAVRKALNNSNA